MSAPIVFLDTETTHLHPDLRRPWEIAMIKRLPDHSEQTATIIIGDVDLSRADRTSLNIGRFYERHPIYNGTVNANDPLTFGYPYVLGESHWMSTEAQAAQVVDNWTAGAHLVGCVTDFDALTLDRMLRRHGRMPRWHYHLIDVENLAVGYLHAWAEREIEYAPELPWKSDELSEAIGVEPPTETERHTAMGDARWAMRMFDRITGGAE